MTFAILMIVRMKRYAMDTGNTGGDRCRFFDPGDRCLAPPTPSERESNRGMAPPDRAIVAVLTANRED